MPSSKYEYKEDTDGSYARALVDVVQCLAEEMDDETLYATLRSAVPAAAWVNTGDGQEDMDISKIPKPLLNAIVQLLEGHRRSVENF